MEWNALTGQRRRVNGQRMNHVEAEVGRDPITLLEQHHIPRDELLGRNTNSDTVTQHGGAPREEVS